MTQTRKKAAKPAAPVQSDWDRQLETERMHDRHYHRDPQPVPASRRFVVGQLVRYGSLPDCRVDVVEDEGRTLVISYANRGVKYGKPYDHGNRLPRVVRWHDVLPVVEEAPRQFTTDDNVWRRMTARPSTLDALIGNARRWGLIDSPDYQRSYVWTDENRANFLKSIFDQNDIGKFILVVHDYHETRVEVLDGKQRLKTLLDFTDSRFPYRGVYYHELHWRDRHIFNETLVQWIEVNRARVKRSALLWLFLAVNAGGVPQTEEHVAHVRALYEEALRSEQALTLPA